MKFECLINLLEEKGLVKIKRREYDGICISVNIFSEYREVLDKIIITAEEVEIMNNRKQIGSVLRENISTIEEQCVEFNTITDLKDELEFDITKVGDF